MDWKNPNKTYSLLNEFTYLKSSNLLENLQSIASIEIMSNELFHLSIDKFITIIFRSVYILNVCFNLYK
jgi:hypothetical protein